MRQRFLAPATESILLDGEGFLADPMAPMHEWLLGKLVKPEALVDVPWWILLGEPGSGKSSVFEEHEAWLQAQPQIRDGGEIWRFDLKPYASEQRLLRDLFNSPRFLSWRNGTGDLHLLLDSFDEGQFRIDSLAGLLKTELEQLPAEARSRLKLRIACRSGVWLPNYTQALDSVWPGEQTKTYQLAPLRRIDVEQEVQAMGFDAASFISPLVDRRMVPIAIRPITLQLLLKLFKRGELFQQGDTPVTRVEIYRQGCLYLCQEPDAERNTAARRATGLSPQRRLQIAEWIAAVMVFGNRAAIWTGSGAADSTDELSVMELCTDQPLPGQANPITETDLRAVLEGSALFALRGAGHTVWIHQSYAEFLAAQWLVKQQLSERAILEYIRHPDSPEDFLPALQETSSWLAELRPELTSVFLHEQPLILLQNEAGTRTAEQRRQLVESIFQLYGQEHKVIVGWELGQYRRLSHPELAQQLAPVIKDGTTTTSVRCVAIQIAFDAECKELASLLVDVALNPTDALDVRVQAARALVSVGDEKEKSRLVPLAFGQCGIDPEDQLRGYALFAVWPSHLSPPQLFSALIRPKRPNLLGAYQSFVDRLSDTIDLALVPDGLAWAADLPAWHQLPLGVAHLARVIFRLAMSNIDDSAVAQALLRAVTRRLDQNKDPFVEAPSLVHNGATGIALHGRRKLIELMAQSQTTSDSILSRLVNEYFLQQEDLEWLLGKLELSTPPAEHERWLKLVSLYAERILQAPYDDRILDAAARHPKLQKTEPLGPHLLVELGSQAAQNQKASYEAILAWSQEQAKKDAERQQQKTTSPSNNIITCLDHIESDHVSTWFWLIHHMCFDEHGKNRGQYFNAVLTKLPGWIQSPVDVRRRILHAAKRYIMEEVPSVPPIESRVKGAFRPSASSLAGYPAFRLILDEEPQWIEALPKEVWARWAWSLVCYRDNSSSGQNQRLFTLLYQVAPDSLIEGVVNQIRDEDQVDSWPGDLGFLTICWDDRLGQVFLALAKGTSFSTQTFAALLGAILRRNVPQAKEYALSVLEEPIPTSVRERERLLATAIQLLTAVFPPEWPIVFELITKDPQLGVELFRMANWDRRSSWHDQLAEADLADLFTWLWTHKNLFPRREDEEDSEPLQMRIITPEMGLEEFRDGVLKRLIQRGSKESVSALEQLSQCFLAEDKFRIAIELGREQYLNNSSHLHRRAPQQLISMLGRKEAVERSLVKHPKPSSLPSGGLPQIELRRALLIGVNSYQDPNFVALKYCENDIHKLSEVLGAAQYEITKVHDKATEERYRPTRNAVESIIKNICEAVSPEELILIHFSGHGKTINGRPMLVLKDSYNNTLETTGLSVDWILEQFRKSKAQQKILLLDACHVGLELGRESAEESEFVRHVYEGAIGTAIISASTAQQVAGEDRERQMGIFSYYLFKGLQGEAMNAQYKFVTVDGIKNYVLNEIRARKLKKGLSLQEPTFQIEGMGDVIITDYREKSPSSLKVNSSSVFLIICLVIVLAVSVVNVLIWMWLS